MTRLRYNDGIQQLESSFEEDSSEIWNNPDM